FGVVFIAGHLVWLLERGRETFDDRYFVGVFEGIYWAIVTASTVGYGDKAPVRYGGRILAMLVIIISLPMFALFTAELASVFTLQSISASVRGPEDLKGRKVGVVRGTSSASFAAGRGLDIRQWDSADEVYTGLAEGKVAAVIYDAPSLTYYAQTRGVDTVHLVHETFDIRDLALATQQGSPLREELNRALLDLKSSGELTELRVKWFGTR
ncbi:MAG: transporter substrate-binding domain-containing protein, partial [Myxococcota bacterium]